jgi:hypothetical protein
MRGFYHGYLRGDFVWLHGSRRVAEIAEENKPNCGRHSTENSEEPFAAKKLKRPRAAETQLKMNWPQENAKKKRHNLFSMSSLRSFAAKIFLEWRDFFLQWYRFPSAARRNQKDSEQNETKKTKRRRNHGGVE